MRSTALWASLYTTAIPMGNLIQEVSKWGYVLIATFVLTAIGLFPSRGQEQG